ncbi:hypothetical protein CPB83DRAFT_885121 [Crepidotus variabilis]|uniref:NmrA-like domain-containing protein n=1 Tax=Crepidotus variabilis TaxID=179855 RepID=A0A9P6JMY9_9AGAR|nr:hypothetical protein CPB83DRAFT_885121 [Crepidotus variabilis]
MSSIKKVLIAGASGTLGQSTLAEFLRVEQFDVFVLTRPDSKKTFPDSVGVLKTDYSPQSLGEVFSSQKFDAVVSLLNRSIGSEVERALINASKTAGVKRFIPSDFGNDLANPEVLSLCSWFSPKAKIVDYLKELESGSFTWSALITGPFFDWGLQNHGFDFDFKARKFTKYEGSTPFTVTNVGTITKALVNLLSDSERLRDTANKRVYISTHLLTQDKLLSAVEKVTGATFEVLQVSLEETERKARESLASGDMVGAFGLAKVALFKNSYGDFSKKQSNELLGLPQGDLEADLKKYVNPIL